MNDVYTLANLENWRPAAQGVDAPIRLGVFGQPVAHSRSPQMQNAALIACGFPMRYARFEIEPGELPRAFDLVRVLEFVGVNLTIPHKTCAVDLVDSMDEFARAVGSINTVRLEDGRLVGSNTDGPGFAAAILSDFAVRLRGIRIVVLGVGGAGRAIAMQCAREGCKRLTLANRTDKKAQQLAADLQSTTGALVDAVPWNVAMLRNAVAHADLLVNATSVGLHTEDSAVIPRELLRRELMVYDAVYGAAPTPLLIAAREIGAKTGSGLSMLLHQGGLAFETWFHRAAPLREMAAALEL